MSNDNKVILVTGATAQQGGAPQPVSGLDEPGNLVAEEWLVMKTIGVLGELGPQATVDFEARVHRESQQLIPK